MLRSVAPEVGFDRVKVRVSGELERVRKRRNAYGWLQAGGGVIGEDAADEPGEEEFGG